MSINCLRILLRRSLVLRSTMPFYAVHLGKTPGVYKTWSECQAQTTGFRGARFKKFETEEEALNFVEKGTAKKTAADKSETAKEKKSSKASKASGSDSEKAEASDKKMKRKASKDDKAEEDSGPESKQTKYEEEENDPDAVIVYTDGCCINNGKGNPRGGIGVYWGPDHPNNLSEKLEGRQTNNRAEIYAAVRAVEQAKSLGVKKLIIKTDSSFLVNCQTSWVKKWKKNGWKTSAGEEATNRKELEELDAVEKNISVKYIHVPGHSGVEGNEEADKLAKAGSKK